MLPSTKSFWLHLIKSSVNDDDDNDNNNNNSNREKKWKRKVNHKRGYRKQMIAILREIGTFGIT